MLRSACTRRVQVCVPVAHDARRDFDSADHKLETGSTMLTPAAGAGIRIGPDWGTGPSSVKHDDSDFKFESYTNLN
jgi:hypothetical protein